MLFPRKNVPDLVQSRNFLFRVARAAVALRLYTELMNT